MNHREPMIALAKMFKINEILDEPLPSGAMLFWELYQDQNKGTRYIRLFSFRPSQPLFTVKMK